MNPRTLVPLSNLITLQRGFDLPEAARKVGDVPVVASTAIAGYHNETRVSAPGVVIGRSGSIGGGQYITQDFWPLNTTLWVKDFKGHYPRFIYYLLRSIDFSRFNAGAGVPTLNRNHLDSLQVPSFDARTEEGIAQALAAYDDLIENNRRRIALLEQSARLLYREWFVHLRFPGHEHVKVVDGVPEGWAIFSISEVADLYRGISYSSSQLVEEGGKPFVNLKCMNRFGGFRVSGVKRFLGEHKSQHAVKAGDIVVAVTDMTRDAMIVAQAAIVPKIVGDDAVLSMDMVKLVPKPAFAPHWFHALLRFSSFSFEVREKANGATVLHLRPKHIEEWRTPVPPPALRDEYAECVSPMYALMDELELQNEKLCQARDLLLPRLMSGDLVV